MIEEVFVGFVCCGVVDVKINVLIGLFELVGCYVEDVFGNCKGFFVVVENVVCMFRCMVW